MSEGLNLSTFAKLHETPKSRAFRHALDIEMMVLDRMAELGISKKELAERMGISKSNLSNMLNTQPNLTLETIAKFELALNANLDLNLRPASTFQAECQLDLADCPEILPWRQSKRMKSATQQKGHSAKSGAMLLAFRAKEPSVTATTYEQEHVA